MKKIAVGIDFSPESTLAARQALAIARHVGGELVLVHAELFVELPPVAAEPHAHVKAALDTYRSRLARELDVARARLGELRSALAGQGADVSQVVVEGASDEALCQAARDLGADLFVLGTHGRTGLRWFFLGSVAQRVVRLAPVDVLVARRDEIGKGGYQRILVATDFSPSSARALDRALELASPRARIDILHCYPFAPMGLLTEGPSAYDVELDAAVEDDLRQRGAELVAARGRGRDPALAFHLVREPATPAIVHWLETRPYDLAALGSHGRRGIPRALLGSVAEAVVRRAPCSVLVARGDARLRDPARA